MKPNPKAVQSTAPTGAISPIENYHEMQLRINKLLSNAKKEVIMREHLQKIVSFNKEGEKTLRTIIALQDDKITDLESRLHLITSRDELRNEIFSIKTLYDVSM